MPPSRTPAPPRTTRKPAPPSPSWQMRRSAIHGRGLYARTDIPKGARIIEYRGEKITTLEGTRRALQRISRLRGSQRGAVYIFTLSPRRDIDGNVSWNPARFMNHSCAPNCESRVQHGHVWIHARRNIRHGEELTYDYGYDLENWHQHPCRCGTGECTGYIVSARRRSALRRRLGLKPVR